MTKKQIKKLAKLFAAGVTFNALGTGADSSLMTEEERTMLGNEMSKIAFKLIKEANAETEALFIGDLDRLIEYATKK